MEDKTQRKLIGIAALALVLILLIYTVLNVEYIKQSPCKVCEKKVPGMQCTQMVKGQLEYYDVPMPKLEINLSGIKK